MALTSKATAAKAFCGFISQKLCLHVGPPDKSRVPRLELSSCVPSSTLSYSTCSFPTIGISTSARASSPRIPQNLRHIVQLSTSCWLSAAGDANNLASQILNERTKSDANTASIPSSGGSTPQEEEEEKRKKDAFARKAMKWSLVAMGFSFAGAAGFAVLEWGQPQKDEDGKTIEDEFSSMPVWRQYIQRSWRELVFYEKMIKEPSREKLLPDPLKEPYHQPPYTVILEMTGVLVHPDWTYATGWRFKKRPGVEYFLEQLGGPYFEIVIYTNEQAFTAYPILLSLDPNGYIMYKLFRDSTRYVNGKHVKDLSYLNRDLSKVIVVEWDPNVVPSHARNAVFLPKWAGNDDDRTLFELAAFLKTIAASEVDDVRDVLDNYRDEDDVLAAFKSRQKMLKEEQSKVVALQSHALEEKDKRGFLNSFAPSIFGRR